MQEYKPGLYEFMGNTCEYNEGEDVVYDLDSGEEYDVDIFFSSGMFTLIEEYNKEPEKTLIEDMDKNQLYDLLKVIKERLGEDIIINEMTSYFSDVDLRGFVENIDTCWDLHLEDNID